MNSYLREKISLLRENYFAAKVVRPRVMYLAVLERRVGPCIELVPVVKMFKYFNNHYIILLMRRLNQFKLINFIQCFIIVYVVTLV